MRYSSNGILLMAALILVLVTAETGWARTEVTPIRLNKTIVLLPAPPGFTEASRRSAKMQKLSRLLTLPHKEFLVLYVSTEDMQRIRSGKQPQMKQYITAQISSAARKKRILVKTFRQLRAKLRQRLSGKQGYSVVSGQKQINRITGKLRQQAPDMKSIKVGTMRPIGILFDGRQAISYGVLVKYRTSINNMPEDILMVGSVTYVMVRNKLLSVYVFRVYKNDNDIQWVNKTTKGWVRSIMRRN
ncbi:MAG TPA: hypothetical protein ENG78_04515 [Acidiferrobacteraceae bacterium]|nr:hypothetical protein [Acidiferrobacteraceae bacterium]HEX20066.1 hypothetical protein [Acidiferrobacteraceae bacterium]